MCDLMTVYNGTQITYDTIGNPLSDGTWTYTWEHGRQLASMSDGTDTWDYEYDANGMRIRRSDGTTTYTYVYNGGLLSQMTEGADTLRFIYDASGLPMILEYNGQRYYYVTNMQGDVVAILNAVGAKVVEYHYDAWGNIVSTMGSMASTLGSLNPLRYRGYVYDQETNLYYLQSRYYNPQWGRFLNADSFAATGQGLTGNNVFCYCGNNPVNRDDSSGTFWNKVGAFFSKIGDVLGNIFGAGSTVTTTVVEYETPIIPDPSPITLTTGTITTQVLEKYGDASKPISVHANLDSDNYLMSSAGIDFNIWDVSLNSGLALDNIYLAGSYKNGNQTDKFGIRLNLAELKIGVEAATTVQWDGVETTTYTNCSISAWGIAAAYLLLTTGQDVFSSSPSLSPA